MPEIVIHIGLHKTGTTALQTFFAANEQAFNQLGVFFPQATREKKTRQIIHSNLSWELLGHDMFDPSLGNLEDLLHEIKSRPEVGKWLITSEGLSRIKEPAAFLARFQPNPVTIIAYFRDPVAASPSLYSEQLKAGSHLNFDEWINRKATRWLDRQSMINPWCQAGFTRTGRILDRLNLKPKSKFESSSVRIVQRTLDKESLHQGSLMKDVLLLLGLAESSESFKFKLDAVSNTRISFIECIGLLFLNHLHRENREMNDQQKVKDRLLLRAALLREFPAANFPFDCTPAQKCKLQRLFSKHQREVSPPTPKSDRATAMPDELLDWLRNFKQNEYSPAMLDHALCKARQFSTQQGHNATCYIHIGMAKTGTTSIQSALQRSRKSSKFRYSKLGASSHSRMIIAIFSKTPERLPYFRKIGWSTEKIHQYATEMRTRLEQELSTISHEKFIISGEAIISLKEDELKGLRQFMSRYFSKIHIIAYLRPPKSYMESLFQQRLKSGSYQIKFESAYPSYIEKIQKFDNVFGQENVILRKFEPADFPKRDVVLDFCQLIGIKLRHYQPIKTNESLSLEAIALFLAYRKFGGKFGKGEDAISRNREIVNALFKVTGRKLSFSREMVSAIIEKKRQDIEWIEHRAGFLLGSVPTTDSPESVSTIPELISHAMEGARKLMDAMGEQFTTKMLNPQTPRQAARVLHDFVVSIDPSMEGTFPNPQGVPRRADDQKPRFNTFQRLRNRFGKSKP